MRIIITFLSIFLLESCKDKVPFIKKPNEIWSEEQKRNYFIDTFSERYGYGIWEQADSTDTFEWFFKKHYPGIKAKNITDPFPYAMEEEYIDTTLIDSSRKWFRLIVVPTFRNPYCFIVDQKKSKTYLTTKITNGRGGFRTGFLTNITKTIWDDTLYDKIASHLDSLSFWKLTVDTTILAGYDGERWFFEAIDKGRYNIITRWVPQRYGNSTTRSLSEIGIKLGNLSHLDKILSALEYPESGLIPNK